MVCIKSSASEQTLKYALLIKDDTILDIRSRVLIDGCDSDTYRPIEIVSQKGVMAETHVDLSPQSGRRRQKKAP
jgi:hypothetical protein